MATFRLGTRHPAGGSPCSPQSPARLPRRLGGRLARRRKHCGLHPRRAELRRRLRDDPVRRVLAARDGLGAAGPQRRRATARARRDRLHPPRARIAARDRRRRAHRARRARRAAGPAPLRRPQPDRRHDAPPPPRRLVRRIRELHVVRDSRPAALRHEPHTGTIRAAARWLERHQNRDGGFNVGGRGASGIDDTGYAVQALAAAGRRGSAMRRAAGSSPARRTRRAASRSRAAAPSTRSRRPTRSRGLSPPAGTMRWCAAARRTCAR